MNKITICSDTRLANVFSHFKMYLNTNNTNDYSHYCVNCIFQDFITIGCEYDLDDEFDILLGINHDISNISDFSEENINKFKKYTFDKKINLIGTFEITKKNGIYTVYQTS